MSLIGHVVSLEPQTGDEKLLKQFSEDLESIKMTEIHEPAGAA